MKRRVDEKYAGIALSLVDEISDRQITDGNFRRTVQASWPKIVLDRDDLDYEDFGKIHMFFLGLKYGQREERRASTKAATPKKRRLRIAKNATRARLARA